MPFTDYFEDKKHVIWDWNGTILNDLDHTVDTLNHVLKSAEMEPKSIEFYKKNVGFPVKNFYDELGFTYESRSFEDLCEDFVSYWMNGVDKCEPFDFVLNQIKDNHSSGRAQSILSASDQQSLDHLIDRFSLREYFANVFGVENKQAASKVARGIELVETAGFSKEESILVGDTLHDLEVGEEIGIDVVLVGYGHQCVTRLRKEHSKVIELDLL